MKVTIQQSRHFTLVWQKGQVDLYLKPKGNFEPAYHDLKDEDGRILGGLWNHLNAKKKDPEYGPYQEALNEVIHALDKILEERKKG